MAQGLHNAFPLRAWDGHGRSQIRLIDKSDSPYKHRSDSPYTQVRLTLYTSQIRLIHKWIDLIQGKVYLKHKTIFYKRQIYLCVKQTHLCIR